MQSHAGDPEFLDKTGLGDGDNVCLYMQFILLFIFLLPQNVACRNMRPTKHSWKLDCMMFDEFSRNLQGSSDSTLVPLPDSFQTARGPSC
jgi:hypothetical protein